MNRFESIRLITDGMKLTLNTNRCLDNTKINYY